MEGARRRVLRRNATTANSAISATRIRNTRKLASPLSAFEDAVYGADDSGMAMAAVGLSRLIAAASGLRLDRKRCALERLVEQLRGDEIWGGWPAPDRG
jgi:hypothetical protein